MATITCPKCGEVISVDPSSVEDLTRQLRDELFEHDLEARLAEVGRAHEAQLEAARAEERREADRRVAESRAEKAEVQARLDAAERERELAVERERGEAERRAAASQAEIAQLKSQLASQKQTLKAQGKAELLEATAELDRRRSELESQLAVEKADSERAQAALREEMTRREGELKEQSELQLLAKDAQIEQYKSEVERLKDYRVRLSTKLIGESLERHCESEFNRIRMQAYPHATFEKDNEAIGGTKGDFIFRDFDEEGNEILSIMFEMKNEEELSAATSRKRNEDHFRKLDSDRTKKGCEYAVLVSTLEPDNDFYNAGIADVSWHYPKMFVVRPQCFTAIIGLLKVAALSAHPYRVQLEHMRQEEIDVTNFEAKLGKIVGSIENDYRRAAKNYERAESDIDAIIKKLEDLKKQLKTAAGWFETAQKQGEKLTVKHLAWGNKTMKAAFEEAREAAEEAPALEEGPDPDDEPVEADEVVEADVME